MLHALHTLEVLNVYFFKFKCSSNSAFLLTLHVITLLFCVFFIFIFSPQSISAPGSGIWSDGKDKNDGSQAHTWNVEVLIDIVKEVVRKAFDRENEASCFFMFDWLSEVSRFFLCVFL